MARPSKYHSNIKPHLSEIKDALERGVEEKIIAKNLGVANSSWCKYKLEFPEFAEVFKKADKTELLKSLEGALVKKALGFEYQEKKQYIKKDEQGEAVTYTEITTKYQPPSETAIFGAFNRFDPSYVKDKAYFELKEQELELRKKVAEANNFDLKL